MMKQESEVNNRKKHVLFLCVANSCRSQMAEGLARHYLGDQLEVESAGTMATYVHPKAIRVMAELGIDISHHRSKDVSELSGQSFDLVVTVCEEGDERCPVWLGVGNRVHIPFYDPVNARGTEEEVLTAFRTVRDEMKKLLLNYFKQNR